MKRSSSKSYDYEKNENESNWKHINNLKNKKSLFTNFSKLNKDEEIIFSDFKMKYYKNKKIFSLLKNNQF